MRICTDRPSAGGLFEDHGRVGKSVLSYVLLSLGILAAGTLGLNILVQGLGINYLIAKIIIEGILFFTSYFVQKRWIFSGKEVLE